MDGYAVISKFEINGKNVKHVSRYLQSDAYKKAVKAQRPISCEFGTPPATDCKKGFFAKILPTFVRPLNFRYPFNLCTYDRNIVDEFRL